AIIPAMFAVALPQLGVLNVMHLATPQSAILSAVIFNALIIVALIPLALRGVRYRPVGAAALLRRNLFVYGLGGIIAPFVGIKIMKLLFARCIWPRRIRAETVQDRILDDRRHHNSLRDYLPVRRHWSGAGALC